MDRAAGKFHSEFLPITPGRIAQRLELAVDLISIYMENHVYTVYKITNLINQKFYIGVHKTKDPHDQYMGSGVAIRKAITKYGSDSFKKEILFVTELKEEAYGRERELTQNFMESSNYNMKIGGVGGFTRENSLKGNAASLKRMTREQRSANGKKGYLKAKNDPVECGRKGGLANKGKPKSEEHKQKLRDTWKRKLNKDG